MEDFNLTMSQTEATMSPLLSKVLSMLTLGVGSLLFGLLPLFFQVSAQRRHRLLISLLLCFGAGVLLATAMIHILPEVREQIPKYAELILCCGFFFVYILDELVHGCYGVQHDHSDHAPQSYGSTSETRSLLREPQQTQADVIGHHEADIQIRDTTQHAEHNSASHFGLLLALSIHSILEGLAIGVQDTTTKVFVLLGAVCCHKYVVGFCLGVELSLTANSRSLKQFYAILIFSFGSVLGIGIGMALTDVNNIYDGPVLQILQALAAGTLLYVTVCEVLPREKAKWHMSAKWYAGIFQCISVIIGFTAMTLLTTFFSD